MCCPRVGLSLKRPDKHKCEYVMKSYRYFVCASLLKKGKNLMVLPLVASKKSPGTIAKKLGVKAAMVEKAARGYKTGYEGKKKV